MQIAYTYKIVRTLKTDFIYLDNTLIGSLQKKSWYSLAFYITIREEEFLLKRSGMINPVISIIDKNLNNEIGKIKILRFVHIFPKAFFKYNNSALTWASKSFFSFYWQWKKDNHVIIETLSDFSIKNQSGVIIVSDYFENTSLLIVLGIYIKNNVSRFSLRRFF